MARKYISEGLTRDKAFEILGITKHAYYYQPKDGKPGRTPTTTTKRKAKEGIIWCDEKEVINEIVEVKIKSRNRLWL